MGAPNPARDLEVFKLRRSGMSFADIAEKMGLAGKSGAHLAYTRALQSWGPVIDDVESVKAEQIDRLEQMLSTFYPEVHEGPQWDEEGAAKDRDLKAATMVLRIQAQLSKLYGVDAAERAKTDSAGAAVPVVDELAEIRKQRDALRSAK